MLPTEHERVIVLEQMQREWQAERDNLLSELAAEKEDAQAMRSLRSGLRSDCADWPTEERDGFICTLYRYIGKMRADLDAAREEIATIRCRIYGGGVIEGIDLPAHKSEDVVAVERSLCKRLYQEIENVRVLTNELAVRDTEIERLRGLVFDAFMDGTVKRFARTSDAVECWNNSEIKAILNSGKD